MNWAPPPVAVAIVSWNTRALLGRCLDSLRADADAGLAAVTVVDNGSSDGSAEVVAEPPARPVRPGGVTTPPGSSSVWVPEGWAASSAAIEPGACAAGTATARMLAAGSRRGAGWGTAQPACSSRL